MSTSNKHPENYCNARRREEIRNIFYLFDITNIGSTRKRIQVISLSQRVLLSQLLLQKRTSQHPLLSYKQCPINERFLYDVSSVYAFRSSV